MAEVVFDGVGKTFADGTQALESLDLRLADGEFVVLVGPSGCGKTTALKIVAGLESASSGRILLDGVDVSEMPPGRRDLAMVFQSYALYPHMTVAENIGFALRMQGVPRRERKERVEHVARTLGLEEVLGRKPRNLSGGQRQRVAMGRAIVRQPRAFLMDEPLSNLDARLRVEMRTEILRIQRELRVTTLYVTHDQIEAMTMGDRVAVLRKGVLQQVASPRDLYRRPVNLFVAGFIGSPSMNLLEGELVGDGDNLLCKVGEATWVVPPTLPAATELRTRVGGIVCAGIRPEHLRLEAEAPERDRRWLLRGRPVIVEEMGSERIVHLEVAARPAITGELMEIAEDIDAVTAGGTRSEPGKEEAVIVARLAGETEYGDAPTLALSVDPARVYFFDPATGEPLGADVVRDHGQQGKERHERLPV